LKTERVYYTAASDKETESAGDEKQKRVKKRLDN